MEPRSLWKWAYALDHRWGFELLRLNTVGVYLLRVGPIRLFFVYTENPRRS